MTHIKKKIILLLVLIVPILVISPFGAHLAHAGMFDWVKDNVIDGINQIVATIGYIVLWLVARLVWIAGIFLNMAVYWSLHITELVAKVPVIKVGWTIFRDLANMFFIFMMLWTAINMILSGWSSTASNAIRNLIIAALFINFSFFFTGLAIDASNIVAKGFYEAAAPKPFNPLDTDTYDGGIARAVMKGFGLQTIFDNPQASGHTLAGGIGAGGENGNSSNWLNTILVVVFGSIFCLIASFALFAAAVMIMIRTVVLILLLMLSPLGFVGKIIPETKKYADQWFSTLLNECLWFPLYMVMLYVVLRVMTEGSVRAALGQNDATFASMVSGVQAGAVVVAFNFFLLMFLMLASLIVAKKVGAASVGAGMGWASSLYSKGMSKIGTGAGAVTGWVGRNTVGRAAGAVGNSNAVDRLANRQGFVGSIGKGIKRTASDVAKGSYDVRDAKIPGTKGTLGAGVAYGMSQGTGAKVDFGSAKTDKERKEKENKERAEKDRKVGTERVLGRGVRPELTAAQRTSMGPVAAATYDAERDREKTEITRTFNNMTTSEITGLRADDMVRHADYLSPRHIEALDKSDKFTEQEKAKIKEAHFARTNRAVDAIRADREYTEYMALPVPARTAASAAMPRDQYQRIMEVQRAVATNPTAYRTGVDAHRTHVRGLTDQQLNVINPEMYNVTSPDSSIQNRAETFVDSVSRPQFDRIVNNDRNTEAQRNSLKQSRVRDIVASLTPGNPSYNIPSAATKIGKMHPKDIAQIDISLITDPRILAAFNPNKLASLAKDDTMSEANRGLLKTRIITASIGAARGTPLERSRKWLLTKGIDLYP